ncbi:RluA family pseudouridine synthase [Pseudobacteriovorax antillogorgiicola]|uniref:tRNA pseudouridine65 synthase n=1 Tax=Pseudobacteriovorax antillogorgiicola TaxID=1513793 RepID=A0A1Y6CR12_9BACT|nr:RNA pseudouridine synthase [Pseudobacteriovorax antillogorgiicola]TCS42234.1 tRNA pseudouridine65 synthase [Pseudobacteriovorax antillogorgiicola]SMF82533.1 tRNA pseudouridine65 synthase [Pseudobacteriovorax antillogorgiicola]
MPIKILHETEHWLAVDKPAEISVHNDPGKDLLSLMKQGYGYDCTAVNRLDLGTSGIVLLARSKEAAQKLGELLASREAQKYYNAICSGQPKPTGKTSADGWNIWDLSLSKKAEGRKNPRGLSRDRVPCVTHWQLVESSGKLSQLLIRLETGRKHQIRRHAALAKCPLVGDGRYGSKVQGDRLGLHSCRVLFVDPFSGEDVDVVCEAPVEFAL